MSTIRSLVWVLAAACCIVPASAWQTLRAQLPGQCCQTCRQQIGSCSCTTLHPVVRTRYRQEQVVSYHNQRKIALRQQAYCETVPTTEVQNVTVDEGHYQMVWVPKPVTRQVSRTVMRQRMAYRTVPVAYNECVPRVCTQVVPEQYVTYVPITTTTQVFADVTTCTAPAVPPMVSAPDCAVPTVQTALPQPITTMMAQPNCAVPHDPTCATPAVPTYFGPSTTQASPLVPAPQHLHPPVGANPGWRTVQPRQASAPATPYSFQSARRTASRPRGYGRQNHTQVVPTAAAVWQSRR